MRVLHLDAGREWRGGQRQALLLAAALRERDVEVTLATAPDAALRQRAALLSVPVRTLPMGGDLDLLASWRLARLVRELAPDLVHAHDARSHGIALGAHLFGARVPLVVTRRSLSTRHDLFTRLKYRHGGDRFIAVSHAVADRLYGLGVAEARVRVVPDGLLPALPGPEGRSATDWRARLGIEKRARIIGTVGALSPEKGHATLVTALTRLDETVHAVIVGSGSLEPRLRKQARRHGVAHRLHLAGTVSDVQEAIRGFELYVQPSLAEGLGTAALEAMAQGVPVVASRAGGLAELVSDGETGLLVPPGDVAALAAALHRLLADGTLARRLADHATGVVQAYALDSVVTRVLAVYAELGCVQAATPAGTAELGREPVAGSGGEPDDVLPAGQDA